MSNKRYNPAATRNMWNCYKNSDSDGAKRALLAGADPNAPDNEYFYNTGEPFFEWVIRTAPLSKSGGLDLVEACLQAGVAIDDHPHYDGETVLFTAVKNGEVELTKLLLRYDVNLHRNTVNQHDVLFFANTAEMISMLLDADAASGKVQSLDIKKAAKYWSKETHAELLQPENQLAHGAMLRKIYDTSFTDLPVAKKAFWRKHYDIAPQHRIHVELPENSAVKRYLTHAAQPMTEGAAR